MTYADPGRRLVNFKKGQGVFLKVTSLPISETSRALRPRFVGRFRIIRMAGENAATLGLPVSWLVHPVSRVSFLLSAEEAPHLGRSPLGQEPTAQNEYVVEATVGQQNSRSRKRPGLQCRLLWLDGTTTWEPRSTWPVLKKRGAKCANNGEEAVALVNVESDDDNIVTYTSRKQRGFPAPHPRLRSRRWGRGQGSGPDTGYICMQ